MSARVRFDPRPARSRPRRNSSSSAGVAETCQLEALAARAVQLEEAADRLGASDRDDSDALRCEVATLPLGERFDREPVAHSLDEDNRSGVEFHMLHS